MSYKVLNITEIPSKKKKYDKLLKIDVYDEVLNAVYKFTVYEKQMKAIGYTIDLIQLVDNEEKAVEIANRRGDF